MGTLCGGLGDGDATGDEFRVVPPDSCCVDEEGDDVRFLVMVRRRGTAGGHGVDSGCGGGGSVLYQFEKGKLGFVLPVKEGLIHLGHRRMNDSRR